MFFIAVCLPFIIKISKERLYEQLIKPISDRLDRVIEDLSLLKSEDKKSTEIKNVITRIDGELQCLQIKFNNSFSGLYLMGFMSRGYSHQHKICALYELKQELEELEKLGNQTFASEDIKTVSVTKPASITNTL